MNTVKIKSYAKVNLTLEITGVENGFHLLDSLVASIDLFDLIVLKKRKDNLSSIVMHGMGSEGIPPEKNNALKAAEAFSSAFQTCGVDITVYKNIPIGAGLGGSSADVVGVLNGMARLYGVTDKTALKTLADGLGSDTGYMLTGGFARMQGRGEKVTPLALKNKLHLLLICPSSEVSAGACYKKYDELPKTLEWKESATQGCIDALTAERVNDGGRYLMNNLYIPALHLNPDVETAYEQAKSFSPLGAVMTGSGSAVFALFETKELCQWAQSRYKGKFRTYVAETLVPDYLNDKKTLGLKTRSFWTTGNNNIRRKDMEERIIDDEYGRGVRLKKTKDGFVDVTDELADGTDLEEGEEITFEFPNLEGYGMEQDNEDLVDLSPEEAARFLKEKAEAAERRRAEYESTCAQGKALLESGSFNAAEIAYEKALQLDEEATDASVGYWRAKTADFTNPDVLISEYVDAGIESLEYDLGYEATDVIKKNYRSAFEKRIAELTAEEEPLRQKVEEKQDARREVLSSRKLRWGVAFVLTLFPVLAAIIATMVVAFKNFSTREGEYIVSTIILACVSIVFFIAFMVVTNKYINAGRMYRLNERLSSTPDGERLMEIVEYKELYKALLVAPAETDDETEEE